MIMNQQLACLLGTLLLCPTLLAQTHPTAHHYFSKKPHEPTANWSYAGTTGPAFWGKLDPSYDLASSGKHQSPINLDTNKATKAQLPELKFDYRSEQIAAINNGHTIQHADAPGSFLHVGQEKFSLEQFHLHSPSEHTIDGKQFDLEIHFVHKSKQGEVVVVGVLAQADDKAELDFPLYNDLPTASGEQVAFEGTRNPADYLPKSRDYFTYDGSFTTPPCTEHVRWIVMKQPLSVPPKLIERFTRILNANNRPIQHLHERGVKQTE
jgi:carbonic anhydrase